MLSNRALIGLMMCAGVCGGGCAGPARPDDAVPEVRGAPPRQASQSAVEPEIAATIDGEPLTWAVLRPLLVEAAGAEVLREAALDARLRRELTARGLTVGSAEIAAERQNLSESLASAGIEPARAEELTQRLRREQGLGEKRFAALLERTAMLRALVRNEVVISEVTLRQAHAIAHGPKYRGRLIIVSNQGQASALRAELVAAGAERSARFSRVAIERSLHESGPRGGVLAPFSTEDPLVPSVVRSAAQGLTAGELSPVLAMESGFGLLLVDEVMAGDGTSLDAARPRLERQVRLRQERLLMDRLAQQLLREGRGINPVDPALRSAWQTGRPAGG